VPSLLRCSPSRIPTRIAKTLFRQAPLNVTPCVVILGHKPYRRWMPLALWMVLSLPALTWPTACSSYETVFTVMAELFEARPRIPEMIKIAWLAMSNGSLWFVSLAPDLGRGEEPIIRLVGHCRLAALNAIRVVRPHDRKPADREGCVATTRRKWV